MLLTVLCLINAVLGIVASILAIILSIRGLWMLANSKNDLGKGHFH
jgi:hypothetical protein